MSLHVIKRDGSKEPLNIDKIHKVVFWATEGLSGVSASEVEIKSQIQFYNNIESKKIHETIIKAASELISENATNYQYVAGRLINYQLRKEVYGRYEPMHVYELIKRNVAEGFYDDALLSDYTEEEWNQINGFINHERDMKLAYAAMEQLRGKYLVKNRVTGQIYETPQICYVLIAATLFSKYPKETRLQYVKDYYDMVSKHYISLPTPIMAGVRTPERQFSSCFPAGQMVLTDAGLKPIETISVGEKVLTKSGAYHPVLATREKENTERFVTLTHNMYFDDSFTTTENHNLYVLLRNNDSYNRKWSKPVWASAKDIRNGDYVHIAVNKDITPLTEIKISDFVDIEFLGYGVDEADMIRKYVSKPERYQGRLWANNVTTIKNTIPLNEDFYRLIGYFCAEGHVHADDRAVFWTLGTHEKGTWIEDIKQIIKKVFGYDTSIEEKLDNSSVIKMHSVIAAKLFRTLCGTGFASKNLHHIIKKANIHNQKAFLIGLIRGDGCVHANGCNIGMSNQTLVQQVSHIMIRCGLYPSMTTRTPNKSTGKTKVFCAKQNSYIINLAAGPNRDFILSIGKNVEKLKEIKGNAYSISKFVNGDFFTRVRNVAISEKCPLVFVYDLQVDNDQSFTVAGATVHNCVLIETDDSLKSITATSEAIVSYVSKKAGIGIGAGRIRAQGSPVRKGDTSHTGVTPFYRYFQTSVRSCSQGGVRNGAATLYVPIFHLEIEDIIVLKNNKGVEENRVRHMDYGIQINKLFYERLISGGNITLFSPSDIKEAYEAFFTDYDRFKELYEKAERNTRIRKKVLPAIELFTILMQERKDTGRIYIQNVDNCNTHSSFIEKEAPIRQSNLCVTGETEISIAFRCGNDGDFEYMTIAIEDLGYYMMAKEAEVLVLSKNLHTKEDEYRKIEAFAKTSSTAKVMKITDEESGKSVRLTSEHFVYTKNRGYIKAGELIETDELEIR
jgi:intein/homing endonuclease